MTDISILKTHLNLVVFSFLFYIYVSILNGRAFAALIFYYYWFLFDSLKSLSTLLADQKRLNLNLLMGLESGGSSYFSRMFC